MTPQLPLALRWPAHQTFDDFLTNDGNELALAAVRQLAMENASWIFLSGAAASGKTHLLIAACVAANAAGRNAQYLPLATLDADRESAIRAFGGSEVLALDNLDSVAGDRAAEHALFDLYNRCRAENATLLFASRHAPAQLGLTLPDLQSRLGEPSRDGVLGRTRILTWVVSWDPLVKYLGVMADDSGTVVDVYWNLPSEVQWSPMDRCK